MTTIDKEKQEGTVDCSNTDLKFTSSRDTVNFDEPSARKPHKDFLDSNTFRYLVMDAVTYYENRKFLNETHWNNSFNYLINQIRENYSPDREFIEREEDFAGLKGKQSDVELGIALMLKGLLRNELESNYRFLLEGVKNLIAESLAVSGVKLREFLEITDEQERAVKIMEFAEKGLKPDDLSNS